MLVAVVIKETKCCFDYERKNIVEYKLIYLTSASVVSLDILIALPWPIRSHFSKLFRTLANRGHNVTVIIHYPIEDPPPNYRDVAIGNLDYFLNRFESFCMFQNFKTDKFTLDKI